MFGSGNNGISFCLFPDHPSLAEGKREKKRSRGYENTI